VSAEVEHEHARAEAAKKSARPATRRDALGRYVRGASGNPTGRNAGRPAIPVDVREMAKLHSAEALEFILATMRNAAVPYRIRVLCAELIIERGHGKALAPVAPSTAVNILNVAGLAGLSPAELHAFQREARLPPEEERRLVEYIRGGGIPRTGEVIEAQSVAPSEARS